MANSLEGASLFTVFIGEGVAESRADALGDAIVEATDLEVDLVDGGQPHYPWLISLE